MEKYARLTSADTIYVPVPGTKRAKLRYHIVPETNCWEWDGSREPRGYGLAKINGRTIGAHRLSYTVFVGPIPDGKEVCHRCDNPSCINPSHLYVATHAENQHDMSRKGRAFGQENSPMVKRGDFHLKERKHRSISQVSV